MLEKYQNILGLVLSSIVCLILTLMLIYGLEPGLHLVIILIIITNANIVNETSLAKKEVLKQIKESEANV